MTPFLKIFSLFTFAVALMSSNAVVRAGVGGIQDNGAFFSERARVEASRVIGDVERTVKKDIVVETLPAIPESAKSGANLTDKAAVNRFFQQWAEKQARLQEVNGIYILLVKQPAHLQVVVGTDTSRKAFTPADRDALVSIMLAKLRAKDNDAALIDGVNFAASTMRAHAGIAGHAAPVAKIGSGQDAQGSSWGWVLPVLIGAVVLWVVFGLLRSLFGGSANPTGAAPGAGGGGFGRSLLGGLFGAAAGMWMYDQFFGSHGHASSPPDQSATPGGSDSGFSGQDTDYTSSGGGFGDDSGGGFGGGDSGGFGGGDSGGGGDF